MAAPTVAWDETSPAGSQAASLGDDRIREMKIQVREIMAVDHIWSASGSGATWGFHNKVTLQTQISNPTPIADTGILFTKDVSSVAELHWINENNQSIQLTSGSNFIAAPNGLIAMWSGTLATIPTGWALCDGGGTPARPNLLAKFIRGVATGATNPGSSGGSDSFTISETNLPIHSHSTGTINVPAGTNVHNHTIVLATASTNYGSQYTAYAVGSASPDTRTTSNANDVHTHTIPSFNTSTFGNASPSAISKLPPYYELAFIIKT